jgi:L-asparaginase
MSRVRIINTGGTLSMRPSDQGFQPCSGYLAEQMSNMSELSLDPMPEYDIHEFPGLIDSSNVTPAVWMSIAQDIEQNYSGYDGFVILHGTDTMAYTASALPLMLSGLDKPVVLTGAQLPLGQLRNDARENLKTAMVLAANYKIPEVSLFFDDRLFRGCRSTKVSATRFDAFESPNHPPLAIAETSIRILEKNIRQPDTRSATLKVQEIVPGEVASFRLFPGLSVEILKHFLRRPLKALILETYGDGNGPANNTEFLRAIESAVDDGMVIVGCTQCLHGGVTQSKYATGTALAKVGVISARDMTIEAVFAKLLYLFSSNLSSTEIKNKFSADLVGELTPTG